MRHICKRILVFSMMVACIASIVLSSFAVVPVSAKGKNKKASTEKKIEKAKNAALSALISRQSEARESLYVYKDFDMSENHYTQKAKMSPVFDEYLVMDMDENWQEKPYSGSSCIRCEQITKAETWGGWLFLNGYLPAGESVPRLNDGSQDGQGLDLTGAEALKFWARGEKGGEIVEFYTCGFGYEGESGVQLVEYPDSTQISQCVGRREVKHIRSSGRTVNRKKAQACGRNIVELGVRMSEKLVAFLRSCVKRYRIIRLVLCAERDLLVSTVDGRG